MSALTNSWQQLCLRASHTVHTASAEHLKHTQLPCHCRLLRPKCGPVRFEHIRFLHQEEVLVGR